MSSHLADLVLRQCKTQTPTQKLVLFFLAFRQNEHTGQNNWSVPHIAEQTCLSDRAVQKAVKFLSSQPSDGGIGVIRRTQRKNNSSLYFVDEGAIKELARGEFDSPQVHRGGEQGSPQTQENELSSPAGEHDAPQEVNPVHPKDIKLMKDTLSGKSELLCVDIVNLLRAHKFQLSTKDKRLTSCVERGATLSLFQEAIAISQKKEKYAIEFVFGVIRNKLDDQNKEVASDKRTSLAVVATSEASPKIDKFENQKIEFNRFQSELLGEYVLSRVDAQQLIRAAEAEHWKLRQQRATTDKNYRVASSYLFWSNFLTWAKNHRHELVDEAFVDVHHKNFEDWLEWTSVQRHKQVGS